MIEDAINASEIELRVRELQVRAWCAGLHETASHLVRATLLSGHLRLYSVPDGQALAITSWRATRVGVRVPGEPHSSDFDTVQGALDLLDAMVEHHAACRAEAKHPVLA